MVFKYKKMSLLFQNSQSTPSFKGVFPKGRYLIYFLNNKQVHFTNPTILLSSNKTDSSIQIKSFKIAQ